MTLDCMQTRVYELPIAALALYAADSRNSYCVKQDESRAQIGLDGGN